MDLTLHHCDDIVFELHIPNNSNTVVLEIKRQKGEPVRLTFFGFPEEISSKLMKAFGEPKKTHWVKHLTSSEDYMERN